jgi:pimeloyl-ACP methyl ester carboxylesterase
MKTSTNDLTVPAGTIGLKGNLTIPEKVHGLVFFSHGSGSSRFSPRNRFVASALNVNGFATLLIDLLSPEEDEAYSMRFDIDLLTRRLIAVTKYVNNLPTLSKLPIGLFGASTGAASALKTAAALTSLIGAVVSRGGRPDLAQSDLPLVKAPVLLVVGGWDGPVIEMNESAYRALKCEKEIVIVEGATHLFEEEGKLEEVAELATGWFLQHLKKNITVKQNKKDEIY